MNQCKVEKQNEEQSEEDDGDEEEEENLEGVLGTRPQ